MNEKKKVIILDSDFNLIEDLRRRFLLEPNYEIVNTASLASEGMGKIRQLPPDYVIIAHPLPDAETLRFVADLNNMYPQIKKIVTLEVQNQIFLSQCLQTGANYVLIKPYSADNLIEIFHEIEKKAYLQPSPFDNTPSVDKLRGAFTQFQQEQVSYQSPPYQQQMPPYQQQVPPQQAPPYQQQMPPYQQQMVQPSEQQAPQGRGFRTLKQTIVAINCPKGGVGKTTISKELATAFATVTVNGQRLKVLLMDCDIDFGDVTSMLKLNSYPNIVNWTSDITQRLRANPHGQIRYSQQQIEEKFLITHNTGLKILAAPSNHSDALDITAKEVEIILENLKNCDYDVIILDTGNNTKDYSLVALDKAHVILMVTTVDVATINDTNMLLRTLRSIQFPTSKIKLVLNRLPKERDFDIGEIPQVLQSPIIGIIPEYNKIRTLNNGGTPAVLGKDSEYTVAIRKLANTIVPVFGRQISGGEDNKEKASEKTGIFSRLFKR